jgi:hypothetical protein
VSTRRVPEGLPGMMSVSLDATLVIWPKAWTFTPRISVVHFKCYPETKR